MADLSNQIFAAAALRMLSEAGYSVGLSSGGDDILVSGLKAGPWRPELVQTIEISRRHGTVPMADVTKLLQAAEPRRTE